MGKVSDSSYMWCGDGLQPCSYQIWGLAHYIREKRPRKGCAHSARAEFSKKTFLVWKGMGSLTSEPPAFCDAPAPGTLWKCWMLVLLFSPPSLTASQRGVEGGSDDHSLMCWHWFISVVYTKQNNKGLPSSSLLPFLLSLIQPCLFLFTLCPWDLWILHCVSFLQEDCSHALCSMGWTIFATASLFKRVIS